ncbi:MAG: PqqD family protein [Desulfobulbaceae bacterium]|nr:PqqD family protein [Desulfobulbaceae bacterium]
MNKESIFKQVEYCIHEEIDNEHIIYNPVSMEACQFNKTSAMIWELCDGKHSIQQISDILEEIFTEQNGDISGDVSSLVKSLVESNVLYQVDSIS